MKSLPSRLVPGRDGPPKVVNAFNEMRERVQAITVRRGSGGILVRETSGGTSISVERQEVEDGVSGTSRRMLVTAIYADYYECLIDGLTVKVAKPWRNRRRPFNGLTIDFVDEQGRPYSVAYTYDGGDTSPSVRRLARVVSGNGLVVFEETQVIIPRIKTDFDYVDAMVSENGTGVVDADNTSLEIDLIDLNTDGRAWARER